MIGGCGERLRFLKTQMDFFQSSKLSKTKNQKLNKSKNKKKITIGVINITF
jgi:hypothetical protein